MRDEMRLRFYDTPGKTKEQAALEAMNEMARRIYEEQAEREKQLKLETDEHEIIEGEVVDP